MTISVGTPLPDVAVMVARPDSPMATSTGPLFASGKTVLFAVPGAYTPTCSARHLPGFMEKAPDLKAKGVELIACVSINDAFVMAAWAKKHSVSDEITMLADGNGAFTQALGLERDMTERGMGLRSQRYAMILQDGVVKDLFVESPGGYGVSSAEYVLSKV